MNSPANSLGNHFPASSFPVPLASAVDIVNVFNRSVREKLTRLFGQRFSNRAEDRQELSKTTLPKSTYPLGVVQPENRDEVIQLMKILNEYQIPWHPFSRGCNWGYGARCASEDNHLMIDLRRMNRIVEINEELAYAVIEPGVSQGQLAMELEKRNSGLMLDVTGAGPDASIVGNTLQRGFGHTPYGDHFAHSCNYEAVLPDGSLKRTGFGDVTNSDVGHVYPYGNGPCDQGSFVQSNQTVVTRMTIWLMPRPQTIQGFGFKTNDLGTFRKIVDRVGQLRREGIINSVVHIANDIRVLSTKAGLKEHNGQNEPFTPAQRMQIAARSGMGLWNGLGGLYGTNGIVNAKKKEIRQAFKGLCKIRFFSQRHVQLLNAAAKHAPETRSFERMRNLSSTVSEVYELLCGRPSQAHLQGAFNRNRPPSGNVIDSGLIWIAPVIPNTGSDTLRLLGAIEPIANRHGFDLPVTISPVAARSAVCVCNLWYDKQVASDGPRASSCYREIRQMMDQLGYPPYRTASIDLEVP
ncbi:MAG: FAD-dependent oxidoreductase [Planctomycetota bacterium]|nr:FAD-dependent oxidoreductase [Planctomycetota bacterium]